MLIGQLNLFFKKDSWWFLCVDCIDTQLLTARSGSGDKNLVENEIGFE